MPAPKWLNRVTIDAIHLDQIREHGGLLGIENESVLLAALERPKRKWEEEDPKPDLARLAATYGEAIAADKPFRDGNARTAFLAMVVFLELNGRVVTASEEEVLLMMLAVSDGKVGRKKLAVWVRETLAPD
jgi:death-on-curing protein